MAKSGISINPNTDTIHSVFQYTPPEMMKPITSVHTGITGWGLIHKLAQLKPEELDRIVVVGMNGNIQLLDCVDVTNTHNMLILCQT